MTEKKIILPLTDEIIAELKAGDMVLLSGIIYVARDAAHKKIIETLDRGEASPFEIKGAAVYYMGPSPAKPGAIIGAAGPTTSGRMDIYTPRLLKEGLKGMIGKGFRSEEVKKAIVEYKAVYFAAIGGIGALISKCIRKSEVIAYPELGPEAVLRLGVEDFPVIVVNDIYGNDLYKEGVKKYSETEISFWQGMTIEQIFQAGKDLIVRGSWSSGTSEKRIEFPLARDFILEKNPSDYSQDVKLRRDEITGQRLEESIPDKQVILGVKYNEDKKRNEVVQIALPNGWCWDET